MFKKKKRQKLGAKPVAQPAIQQPEKKVKETGSSTEEKKEVKE